MWFYNILGDNNGSISHLLQLDPMNPGYVLLTFNFVVLKRENTDPILTVKRIERRKLIDHFGLSIEDKLIATKAMSVSTKKAPC